MITLGLAKVNNAVKFREMVAPVCSFVQERGRAGVPGIGLRLALYDPYCAGASGKTRGHSLRHTCRRHCAAANRREGINPLYYHLIDEFGKPTGVPVVMNTSFNLRGEAILQTPTGAIRTFFSSGIDALILGSFLVEK